jgi:hypothetical protein
VCSVEQLASLLSQGWCNLFLLSDCLHYLARRAWQAELLQQHYYAQRIGIELDCTHSLGLQGLNSLNECFGSRRTFIGLCNTMCHLCGLKTAGFSFLVCARVCNACYSTSSQMRVCSTTQAQVGMCIQYAACSVCFSNIYISGLSTLGSIG